jgi:hypothetical protein
MEAGENDRSQGNREPHGQNLSLPRTDRKAPGFAEAIRRQFREVVNALTRHVPTPELKQRRKRTEETTGGFILTATQIMRRSVGVPEAAFTAIAFLSDTLDWLNPWHYEVMSASGLDDDLISTEPNHLFPRL